MGSTWLNSENICCIVMKFYLPTHIVDGLSRRLEVSELSDDISVIFGVILSCEGSDTFAATTELFKHQMVNH